MYLKSLKLTGFKSFADRTRLEFRPGVTVVVGPNGSGKSNVVDAIAWVMGTQSPKALRTSKMDDVIFAGTATRPGLGRAEVTLVFDNTSGMLPLDLPEVSVTRRLYRDGSSDYEINGVGCRLLDIQELLSDSGVGRQQHVIVGQGQITSILNATPDQHRAVVEEAAGILKHRVRKDKALRRLERTDADVVRLHDLLGEIGKRMRPLKRQASAALRHAEVAEAVQTLRLAVGARDLRAIDSRTAEITEAVAADERTVVESERARVEVAGTLAELRAEAGDLGAALDRDSAAAAKAETVLERLRRIGQVAHERHRTRLARLEGAGERRRDLEAEAAEVAERIEETARVVLGLETAESDAERLFRRLEDEERSLTDQEEMSTEGAIAVVRGDLRSLEMADDRDQRELTSVESRIETLTSRIAEERTSAARLNDEIRDLDAVARPAQERYDTDNRARAAAQEKWETAEAAHADARVGLVGAQARREALLAAAEGLADPEARGIVENASGALGSVAAALDVPAHLASAVDAALGAWSDGVVFGDAEERQEAITALKSAGRGGVPLVGPGTDRPSGPPVSGAERLADLLGPTADRRLAASLIGDVYLVEGWQSAHRLAVAHPDLRFVTPEGDLITADGVRVAHPDGATPAMIEVAEIAVERAEIELARAESLRTQAKRTFDEARQSERDSLETLESLEARMAGATESLARLDREIQAGQQELDRLVARQASLQEAISSRTEMVSELRSRLAALEGEEAERQAAWEALVARRRAVGEQREEARSTWQEQSAALRAAQHELTMLRRRRDEIGRLLEAEETEQVDPAALDRLQAVADAARQATDALRIHLDELRRRQAALREEAGEAGARLTEAQQSHDRHARLVSEAKERLGAWAVERAELRVRREQVLERLRRDADADEETAMSAPVPDVEGSLDDALATREAELRRMGPVNPLAAAEYAELEERHSFLTGQLEDLEASRNELRKVITALDGEIQSQFLAAFEEIAAAYERHFSVLFPGGRGRLRLTDPDDLLTTGVEIEAQPLGKKVTAMTLLSGGERSLAALAFLFAVFDARPSPFYVLDEVEAALDDANLHRFVRLLDEFRSKAQMLIITHQQQTMEAGDVLYGVTMEPGGSSKVVAKSMAQAAAELEQSAAR
ncbi:MAG: chromosome segregation protein SMC [Acidimicrobiia bacterium]|nr:chromosome segregation protein SMC [Acidimicrobiia bacterium]